VGTRDVVVVVQKDDHSLGLELPLLGAAEDLFAAMVGNGDGGLDHSGVIRESARRGPPPQVVA
jgi:3-hydroxyisobutyrate dehydrogenase-like beta-hydroxyacid dehydrogenase